MKNCPNCGSPLSPEQIKCEYCGTYHYDMSAINFDDHEPFYLTIKIQGRIITQLVSPSAGAINISSDETCIYQGTKLTSFRNSPTITTDLSFKTIPQENIYIKVYEGEN